MIAGRYVRQGDHKDINDRMTFDQWKSSLFTGKRDPEKTKWEQQGDHKGTSGRKKQLEHERMTARFKESMQSEIDRKKRLALNRAQALLKLKTKPKIVVPPVADHSDPGPGPGPVVHIPPVVNGGPGPIGPEKPLPPPHYALEPVDSRPHDPRTSTWVLDELLAHYFAPRPGTDSLRTRPLRLSRAQV